MTDRHSPSSILDPTLSSSLLTLTISRSCPSPCVREYVCAHMSFNGVVWRRGDVLWHGMSCRAEGASRGMLWRGAVLSRVEPWRAMPNRAVLCRTMPSRGVPWHAKPCRTVPYRGVTLSDASSSMLNTFRSYDLCTSGCVPATCVPTTCVPATCVPATCVPATCVPAACVPATCVPATCVPAACALWHISIVCGIVDVSRNGS